MLNLIYQKLQKCTSLLNAHWTEFLFFSCDSHTNIPLYKNKSLNLLLFYFLKCSIFSNTFYKYKSVNVYIFSKVKTLCLSSLQICWLGSIHRIVFALPRTTNLDKFHHVNRVIFILQLLSVTIKLNVNLQS